MSLLRQTFGLVLERCTGPRTAQADSPASAGRLLSELDGDIALAVVSVDTPDGPDAGLKGSKNPLARALEAGADDAISLETPMTHFVDSARQLGGQARSG